MGVEEEEEQSQLAVIQLLSFGQRCTWNSSNNNKGKVVEERLGMASDERVSDKVLVQSWERQVLMSWRLGFDLDEIGLPNCRS